MIELLGFGGSSCPKEVQKYSPLSLAIAAQEIVTLEGIEKAVIVGHGWVSCLESLIARIGSDSHYDVRVYR